MTDFELNPLPSRHQVTVSESFDAHVTSMDNTSWLRSRPAAMTNVTLRDHSWGRKALGACSVAMFLILALAVVPEFFGWGALPVTEGTNAARSGDLAIVRDGGIGSTKAGDLISYQTPTGMAVATVIAVNSSGNMQVSGATAAAPAAVSEYDWLGSVSTVLPGLGWIGEALMSPALPWVLTVGQFTVVLALLGVHRSKMADPRVAAAA